MALPINIEDLIHGKTIEWERLEFKQGWNPEDVMHSMCAFANDFHNWGGGYIIVGIKENDGVPVFPPIGLELNQLDSIHKKIVELGHKISPTYFPISQPYILDGNQILVIWCPAGDNRPYSAPVSLGQGNIQRQYYIRIGTKSMIAKDHNLKRLQDLAARIPFDDRINHHANLNDLDFGLIQAYLHEVKSDLLIESRSIAFEELCRMMLIAKGPSEYLKPVNVGLLFFSMHPENFFSRSWIELVIHSDQKPGKNFSEVYFKGPLHKQLRDIISYFSTHIIREVVEKQDYKAEAERYFNFPLAAIEEVLSNAVYHKSYESGSPIEVQVWPDKIEVLSYPGPVPPVDAQVVRTQRRIVAREYRNRRIGDFLKELELTEGRGTGFPTIYNAMANNGSPDPTFETDQDRNYFLVILPAHKGVDQTTSNGDKTFLFKDLHDFIDFSNGASNGVSNGASNGANKAANAILDESIHNRVQEMLSILSNHVTRQELFETMDLTNQSKNRAKYLDPLIELGWVAQDYPGKKTNPNQRYKITKAGEKILALLKS